MAFRKNKVIAVLLITSAGSGHPGGSLSAIDILTVLYYQEMEITLENYDQKDRDHFILSKGHAAIWVSLQMTAKFS
jgi:transketolase N-terminal domain/subunit